MRGGDARLAVQVELEDEDAKLVIRMTRHGGHLPHTVNATPKLPRQDRGSQTVRRQKSPVLGALVRYRVRARQKNDFEAKSSAPPYDQSSRTATSRSRRYSRMSCSSATCFSAARRPGRCGNQ